MEKNIITILTDEKLSVCDRYTTIYRKCLSEKGKENYLYLKDIIELSSGVQLPKADEDNSLFKKIANQYYMLLKEIVSSIARKNLIPEEFYERLYANVFQSNIFPEKESERGIILYLMARRISGLPYYQAYDPVILEDNEFREVIKSIENELEKAKYMMNDRFDSRTEITSQLCDIADSLETREKKSVFWACVLNNRWQKDEETDK